jgi:hypothetical protein
MRQPISFVINFRRLLRLGVWVIYAGHRVTIRYETLAYGSVVQVRLQDELSTVEGQLATKGWALKARLKYSGKISPTIFRGQNPLTIFVCNYGKVYSHVILRVNLAQILFDWVLNIVGSHHTLI